MALSQATGRAGKHRNPLAIWLLLPFITLGIYSLVWYYKVNRETRDLGVEANPGVSLLAVTLGAFILIPPFVSMFRTGERIAQAQRAAGAAPTCSPAIGLLLWMFLFGSGTFYYQAELNKIWDHCGSPPEGSPVPIAPARQPVVGYPPQAYLAPGGPDEDSSQQDANEQDGDQQRGADPGHEPAP